MRVPPELDSIRTALSRRCAPPAYVERLAGELAEHREDLVADLIAGGLERGVAEAEADRRIGDPIAIAEAAASVLRDTSWTTRHPVLALVLLPALTLPLIWAAILLLAAAAGGILSPSFDSDPPSPWARTLLSISCVACTYCVPAAAGAVFYVIARRRFAGGIRAWTPPLVLAAISSFAVARVFFDASSASTGRLVVGAHATPDPLRLFLPLASVLLLELSRISCARITAMTRGARHA
jgi:hypothetical protein